MKMLKTSFAPKSLFLTGSVVFLFLFGLAACQTVWAASNSSSNSSNNSNSSGRSNNNSNSNSNNGDDNRSDQEYYRWGYRSAVGGFSIDAGNAFRAAENDDVGKMVV